MGQGSGSVRGIGTYLPCTVGQGCSLAKWWQLLPPGHCGGSGAGCFSNVGTYLPGTVGQGCMHCRASVQAVKTVSEPTSQALWGRGAGCQNGLRTYLLGTVGQGCRL